MIINKFCHVFDIQVAWITETTTVQAPLASIEKQQQTAVFRL